MGGILASFANLAVSAISARMMRGVMMAPGGPTLPAPPPLPVPEEGDLDEDRPRLMLPMPRVPEPPLHRMWAAQVPVAPGTAQTATAPAAGAPAGTSYAAQIDTSIACLPCLRGHAVGAAAAGERAQAAFDRGDMDAVREAIVQAAGEIAAFREWDLTEEKLAATPPDTLRVIQDTLPVLEQSTQAPALPPLTVLAAYAGLKETPRFARSAKPTDEDRRQIALRVLPALHWCDDAERIGLAPEALAKMRPEERKRAADAADEIRQARHLIVRADEAPPTAKALEDATAHLFRAAVALTPEPTPEQVQALYEGTRAAKGLLDEHLRRRMLAGHGAHVERAPSVLSSGAWLADRRKKARQEAASRFVVAEPPTRVQRALGVTPETASVFANVLEFEAARGVKVRERELGSIAEGEVTKGAYSDEANAIALSPAATSQDPDSVETLLHEVVHSLLDNQECTIGHTPASFSADFNEYESSPEEIAATTGALLAMQRLGLPLELEDTTVLPPEEWHMDEKALRAELDPQTYERAVWAADVLVHAAREGAGAAPLAAGCPVRGPRR